MKESAGQQCGNSTARVGCWLAAARYRGARHRAAWNGVDGMAIFAALSGMRRVHSWRGRQTWAATTAWDVSGFRTLGLVTI